MLLPNSLIFFLKIINECSMRQDSLTRFAKSGFLWDHCKEKNTMKFPPSVQFYPTMRCNQECSFCFNRNITGTRLFTEMARGDALTLASLLNEMGVSEVDILGGEPLLVPWLRDFTVRLLDTGTTVNISTNGSVFQAVQQFAEISSPLLNFGFSIHGFTGVHSRLTSSDHYGALLSGITTMVKAGTDPVTKSTLTRENLEQIPALISFLRDLGVTRYYLLHEDTIGRGKPFRGFSFPEFRDVYSRLHSTFRQEITVGFVAASGFYKDSRNSGCRCDAGTHKLAIFPDGSVFPCNLFGGFPEYMIGNIFQRHNEKILLHPMLDSFRVSGMKNPCASEDCIYYSVCSGGCPAHCYASHRRFDIADPRCCKF